MTAAVATDGPTVSDDEGSCTRAPAGSVRELLRVALPLVLSSGSLSLMNVIDRVFLTAYSTDALAASTPAGLLALDGDESRDRHRRLRDDARRPVRRRRDGRTAWALPCGKACGFR